MPENNTINSNKPKKGLNFIATASDPVAKVFKWSLTWGLALTILTVGVLVGTSSYQVYLQQRLKTLGDNIETVAKKIQAKAEFEKDFLATQEKLDLYSELNVDEKMIELFPILSALTPDDVLMKDLIIEPDQIEIVCFAVDQTAVANFASNLRLANNTDFDDGKKLTIANPNVQQIAKSTTFINNGVAGFDFSLSFNYSID